MSDKYEMAVTINPLVCPLLHAKLGQCATARERAAVLRALAEKALRLELMGGLLPEGTRPGVPASHPAVRKPAYEASPVPPGPSVADHQAASGVDGLTGGIQALHLAATVDVDQMVGDAIGSQLAGYLD